MAERSSTRDACPRVVEFQFAFAASREVLLADTPLPRVAVFRRGPRPVGIARALLIVALACGGLVSRHAGAQSAPSLPDPTQDTEAFVERGGNGSIAQEDPMELLHQRIAELEQRLLESEQVRREGASPLALNGYVDLGFFVPMGNGGVGWVRDVGNRQVPSLSGYSWTFVGDILGSPINSRGEAADLGDAPGIDRFDGVNSDGAPGFIVNEFNLRLGFALSDRAILRAGVNFMPRSASTDFAIGDFVEVDSAELEYVLTDDGATSVFVGKVLPVFGIEYKVRKSDQRFGITPSLVARYTTGPQLGLKVRTKLFHEHLILAASATNNTSTVEQFDFYQEIDRNASKVLNGRAALSLPLDALAALQGDRVELGLSGEWGAQDSDRQSDRELWLIGLDLQYVSTDFAVKAQIMRGESPGTLDEEVWALELRPSGYLQFDWQVGPRLGLLVRAGLRDAFIRLGSERAYVTHQARLTGGVRWNFNPRIALKAEYYHNVELGVVDSFDNDMATSSLVLSY